VESAAGIIQHGCLRTGNRHSRRHDSTGDASELSSRKRPAGYAHRAADPRSLQLRPHSIRAGGAWRRAAAQPPGNFLQPQGRLLAR
jgi:hypothetical protein